jgi:hypothetical protein
MRKNYSLPTAEKLHTSYSTAEIITHYFSKKKLIAYVEKASINNKNKN